MSPLPNRPGDLRLRLPEGTVLSGDYVVEGEIGTGGFGITYRGRDLSLGHSVAIKEYFPADIGNRDTTMSVHPASQALDAPFVWGRDGFLREAKMLASFRHHNIVRVLRYFEANNTAYMVLEFEEGRSFGHWLNGLGRPPTQEELDGIVAQLCDALATIHGQRLVHRDIAPDNIIIRPDGSPVLLDFGAARYEVASQTQLIGGPIHTTSYAVIKAHYSPIEQRSTDVKRRGPWSDIYSLGATLYRAITGTVPPDAHDRLAGDGDTLLSAVEAATGLGYRPAFLAAIDRALMMRPNERPQSVAAFRELAFAEGTPSVGLDGQTKAAHARAAVPPQRQTFTTIQDQRPPDSKQGSEKGRMVLMASLAAVVLAVGGMGLWIGTFGGGGTSTQLTDSAGQVQQIAGPAEQAKAPAAAQSTSASPGSGVAPTSAPTAPQRGPSAGPAPSGSGTGPVPPTGQGRQSRQEANAARLQADLDRQQREKDAADRLKSEAAARRAAADKAAAEAAERARRERLEAAQRQTAEEEARKQREVEVAKQKAAEDLARKAAESQRLADAARLAEQQRAEELRAAEAQRQAEAERLAAAQKQTAADSDIGAQPPKPEQRPAHAQPPSENVLTVRDSGFAEAMQTELQRLGCYDSGIDGIWGSGSQRAFSNFLKYANLPPADEATSAHLAQAKGRKGRVCPLQCGDGEVLKRGQCVAVERTQKEPSTSRAQRSTGATKAEANRNSEKAGACSAWRKCASLARALGPPWNKDLYVDGRCGIAPRGCGSY